MPPPISLRLQKMRSYSTRGMPQGAKSTDKYGMEPVEVDPLKKEARKGLEKDLPVARSIEQLRTQVQGLRAQRVESPRYAAA